MSATKINTVKKLLYLLPLLIAGACNKSATYYNTGLAGKWQLTEYFISPGDAGAWHQATGIETITFNSDKSFESSDGAYNNAIGFTIIDSAKLAFILPTQMPSTMECYYTIQDNGATLILSPVGCIEGCSNKYKAVKNGSN